MAHREPEINFVQKIASGFTTKKGGIVEKVKFSTLVALIRMSTRLFIHKQDQRYSDPKARNG